MERTMEDVGNKVWWMFFQIGVSESEQKTRINERWGENTIGDFG